MPLPSISLISGIARIGRKARGVMWRWRTTPVQFGTTAPGRDDWSLIVSSIAKFLPRVSKLADVQVSSLLAISGATLVAIAVISAQTIRNTETGQVAPAQVISEAAISGLKPPLKAAPTWNPSEAPLYRSRAVNNSEYQGAPIPNITIWPKLIATTMVRITMVGSRVSSSQNIGNANRAENRQLA